MQHKSNTGKNSPISFRISFGDYKIRAALHSLINTAIGNISTDTACRFLENTRGGLEQIGQFFQVAIHFDPSHQQTKKIDTSFCALVGLLLTILNNYFNDSIDTNMFFWLFIVTLQIGGTAPCSCCKVLRNKQECFHKVEGMTENYLSQRFSRSGMINCRINTRLIVIK